MTRLVSIYFLCFSHPRGGTRYAEDILVGIQIQIKLKLTYFLMLLNKLKLITARVK
jgi:hypothetical protein